MFGAMVFEDKKVAVLLSLGVSQVVGPVASFGFLIAAVVRAVQALIGSSEDKGVRPLENRLWDWTPLENSKHNIQMAGISLVAMIPFAGVFLAGKLINYVDPTAFYYQ